MEWLKIVGVVLGSCVLAALVNLISDRLKRKDAVSDRRDDTADQLEELRAETAEQFEQVDARFGALEGKVETVSTKMDVVALSTKAQAYDRIRHLGLQHIRAGFISADELENLSEMHQAYKQLGGDGFLDRIMAEVNTLRIKPD